MLLSKFANYVVINFFAHNNLMITVEFLTFGDLRSTYNLIYIHFVVEKYDRMITKSFLSLSIHIRIQFCGDRRMKIGVSE